MRTPLKYLVSGFLMLFCFVFSFWVTEVTDQKTPHQSELASTESANATAENKITGALNQLERKIDSHDLTPQNCVRELDGFYAGLDGFRMEDLDLAALQTQAVPIMQRTFQLHVKLHDLMTRWEHDGSLTPQNQNTSDSCIWSFRRAFRALRVATDYLADAADHFPYDHRFVTQKGSSDPVEKETAAFAGGANATLWNEKFGHFGQTYVPQSGDVIISRGMASTSAAIARVTDEDANFSHLTIVYIDPVTKETQTVEAHIEIGSHVFPWATYITSGNARGLVLRYHDPALSDEQNARLRDQAAKGIRDQVKAYTDKHGGTGICYDFGMEMQDHKCIFCSEIVEMAFEKMGIHVPMFSSSLHPKNHKFLDLIGVTATTTFAPADAELDGRFEMVAEWRDIVRIHDSHKLDAILTEVYSWMDDYNYQFDPSFHDEAQSVLGYTFRRIPLLDHLVDKRFPLNMKREMIAVVQALNHVVNAMNTYLDDQEKALSITPKRLSPSEMRRALEQLRIADQLQDKQGYLGEPGQKLPENYRFHHWLHP